MRDPFPLSFVTPTVPFRRPRQIVDRVVYPRAGRPTMRVREILRRQALAHIAFEIGIFFKGLDGVLEIVGGLLLFFVKPETISRVVIALTQHELGEDPTDVPASYPVRGANSFSAGSQLLAGASLFSPGVIKVVLADSLMRG